MNSLLNKVKSSLGLNKSQGNKLSSSSSKPSSSISESLFYEFEIIFHQSSLGIIIESASSSHPYFGSPLITSILSNSEAELNGVQVGDVIIGIETNNSVITYGDFISIIQSLERPIKLRFVRVPQNYNNLNNKNNKKENLTNEDKELQREERANAAMLREKAWEKRVNTASTTRRKKVTSSSY